MWQAVQKVGRVEERLSVRVAQPQAAHALAHSLPRADRDVPQDRVRLLDVGLHHAHSKALVVQHGLEGHVDVVHDDHGDATVPHRIVYTRGPAVAARRHDAELGARQVLTVGTASVVIQLPPGRFAEGLAQPMPDAASILERFLFRQVAREVSKRASLRRRPLRQPRRVRPVPRRREDRDHNVLARHVARMVADHRTRSLPKVPSFARRRTSVGPPIGRPNVRHVARR
mmetsp:Transcript_16321/g.48926  ORF Transcript_16321/g.48926 Transcript_16321/m.48926 type:complete len:228 (-) Transcript_16321:158-841(-)